MNKLDLTEQDVKAIADSRLKIKLKRQLFAVTVSFALMTMVALYFLDKIRGVSISLLIVGAIIMIVGQYWYDRQKNIERRILLDLWSREISE